MDNLKIMRLNRFVNSAYECYSFTEFLKLAIMKLNEFVAYDSGMFFCAISHDCSFFKPYIGGEVNEYYRKSAFDERESYLSNMENADFGKEAYVYKAYDYKHGIIQVGDEPRSSFISSQEDFYIVCIRIEYKGQFLGEIYLHRSKEKPDFDDEDLFTLRLLQPHISTVFNIIHTITAVKYIETNNQISTQKGMCMFDQELSLIGGNVAGIEMLKIATTFGSSILYHIKEQCYDIMLDAVESKTNTMFRPTTLKVAGNSIKIDIFARNADKASNATRFIITLEFVDEAQILTEYKYKFSKREAEVIDGLIQGKNNLQLAKALNLSENTIKTHIKNIYKKTGTNNRTELAYVLMMNK